MTVTSPDFAPPVTLVGGFTVNEAATVTTVSPSSLGQGAVSTIVTVTGTGFVSGADVAIAPTPNLTVGSTTFVNSTTLTVPVAGVDRRRR